jgi:hypothetical protein
MVQGEDRTADDPCDGDKAVNIRRRGLLARHWKPILACILVLNNENAANA